MARVDRKSTWLALLERSAPLIVLLIVLAAVAIGMLLELAGAL